MTEHTINGGNFVAGTAEGDPEKRDYLHAVGSGTWQGRISVGGSKLKVDARVCPGCLFPDAKPGKWPHSFDERCKLEGVTREHARREQELGRRIQ
jgi:hypothetical protein